MYDTTPHRHSDNGPDALDQRECDEERPALQIECDNLFQVPKLPDDAQGFWDATFRRGSPRSDYSPEEAFAIDLYTSCQRGVFYHDAESDPLRHMDDRMEEACGYAQSSRRAAWALIGWLVGKVGYDEACDTVDAVWQALYDEWKEREDE